MPLHDAGQDLSDDIRLAAPEERLKDGRIFDWLEQTYPGAARGRKTQPPEVDQGGDGSTGDQNRREGRGRGEDARQASLRSSEWRKPMSNELPDSHPNNGHPQPQGRTKPLTARRQRFVEEYLLDLNGSQAAIRAGYSEQTATMQASRLLTNANVAAAVINAQAKRAEKVQVTAEWVLKGLIEIHDRAMQHHAVLDREGKPIGEYVYQGQVASRALELLGKHLGMFDKQRSEPTERDPTTGEAAEIVEDERTEGERMREFVAYVRMMGAQRGALQSTVEDFADDIDEMCDQAGVPRRTGEPSTD